MARAVAETVALLGRVHAAGRARRGRAGSPGWLSPPRDYESKAADAFLTVKGGDVVRTFLVAAEAHGAPAALLTDNGAVFTRGPRTPARVDRRDPVAGRTDRRDAPVEFGKVR